MEMTTKSCSNCIYSIETRTKWCTMGCRLLNITLTCNDLADICYFYCNALKCGNCAYIKSTLYDMYCGFTGSAIYAQGQLDTTLPDCPLVKRKVT